ncbi:MerR family transcriptional regulator [Shewanella maritima]|uniref:MerR family transcriptional regulator n=1 Tax=Shewanella maritima TaxID=2520507 RepID=A0A411PGW0_9GAMM|nr:MerR family transcriptional regulator [Shewanella maritima]QBF82622.1 MerR family transcriptional regulator [Shewanella maritima]
MNMAEFSKQAEVSAHTLRYYEKIGLLPSISRNASGHRVYGSKDLVWIEFIKRLKDTAMPLKDILKYSELRKQGASTRALRQLLLEKHLEDVKKHITQQQSHLGAIEAKIKLYVIGKVA